MKSYDNILTDIVAFKHCNKWQKKDSNKKFPVDFANDRNGICITLISSMKKCTVMVPSPIIYVQYPRKEPTKKPVVF